MVDYRDIFTVYKCEQIVRDSIHVITTESIIVQYDMVYLSRVSVKKCCLYEVWIGVTVPCVKPNVFESLKKLSLPNFSTCSKIFDNFEA